MDTVLGVDLGTTHVKWVVVAMETGAVLWEGQASAETVTSGDRSEQDPERIWRLVEETLAEAGRYGTVRRIAFSAAMHSCLAVDPSGRPITGSLTWMDRRGSVIAAAIRASGKAPAIRASTGVPVHAMSPWVKWLFLRDRLPAGSRPVALKDYLVFRLTGEWVTDYSTAAASGFLGVDNAWSEDALAEAAISPEDLPRLAPIDVGIASRDGRFEVLLGASDGATAHIHLRIPRDGQVAVLAMGTSGALRTTLPSPVLSRDLFCYTLGPGLGYLVGSAYSNVGNVLWWMAQLFGRDVDSAIQGGLLAIESGRPLPLCLPYWYGERSPWWREDLRGAWLALDPAHGPDDLVASGLLAIAAGYQEGLRALKAAGASVAEIRGGSGLLDRPGVAQWMADALGQGIVLQDDRDASLLGAVDLALPGRWAEADAEPGKRFLPRGPGPAVRVGEVFEEMKAAIEGHV